MLVIQDMLTVHGSQFKGADCLVMSPPCQEFSYMAMPWSIAKAKAAAIRADATGKMLADLTRLFDACFRIQREACEAAGRHIPMVVENVRGAQPWVGRARWSFGSFYLWGDVPALMPTACRAVKVPGFRFDGGVGSFQTACVESGIKGAGPSWAKVRAKKTGSHWTNPAERGTKNSGGSWFNVAHNKASGLGNNPVNIPADGRKGVGADAAWFDANLCRLPSASSRRKEASAMIAKIPLALSAHIARTFKP